MREMTDSSRNVLGGELEPCSLDPLTGFFRDGCCNTSGEDLGMHTVCVEVSAAFLAFMQTQGNDLGTPRPEFGFPGLRPGDRWCVCAARWVEAQSVGVAPRVFLESTHEKTLRLIPLRDLEAHAARRE